MPKTQINCPNCRQPIVADIEQLFDVGADPSAKQKLLSGAFNIAQCPHCGFSGNLAMPIVYHDPDKELLLTFVPAEVGLGRDDQERLIGSLINQAVNRLQQEQRKGYLLRPEAFLSTQSLVERILEADGVTKEMIQAQQEKLNLLQRLLGVSENSRLEIAKQEDKLIDAEFFVLLSRLIEASLMSGDQEAAKGLEALQQSLMPVTTFGRELQMQSQEVEAAVASLQEVGQELTREKLLELVVNAPNDLRVQALVNLARPGMDYEFFRLLSERIDRSRGEGRNRLIQLRERLLGLTQEFDQQMEARASQARQMLDTLLQAEDVREALKQSLPAVDEFFLQELNTAMEEARAQGDLEKSSKLQSMIEVIEEVSTQTPEIGLIQERVDAPDEAARQELLETNREQITPEFLDALTGIVAQMADSQEIELAGQINAVYRQVLRFSMETSLNQ